MNTLFLILFILLQIADTWTTLRALELGHREVNPLLNWLFRRFDALPVLVVAKLIGVWVLWYLDAYLITMACCVVYLWVMVSNWRVIR